MARGNWDTGHFQAEIAAALLRELGYEVIVPGDLAPELFYTAVAEGTDIDLWVNGWFPLHQIYFEQQSVAESAVAVGALLDGKAVEGYMVDKKTASAHGIDSILDLKDPAIAALFDQNGNGKADLVGCNAGWACERVISGHLEQWHLREHVDYLQGEYSLLMADALARFKRGEPVFFYAWIPNWTASLLVPGQGAVWITVPETEASPAVPDIEGCVANPCSLGFGSNTLRAVANKAFLAGHPDVEAFLKQFKVPLEDISAQNNLLIGGEDGDADIQRHAREWIERNRQQIDTWLARARAAAR